MKTAPFVLYSIILISVFVSSPASASTFSLRFDGTDDSVLVPDSPSLNLSNAFTVECWINPSALPAPELPYADHLLDKGGAWTRNYAMWINGYNLVATTHTTSGEVQVRSTYDLENEQWYHIAMVADGSQLRVYVDGALTGSIIATAPYTTYGVPLTIGRRGIQNDFFFPGRMHGFRISDIARYLNDFDPPCAFESASNTVGLWKFDEGVGDTLYDSSANNNDGAIDGALWEGFVKDNDEDGYEDAACGGTDCDDGNLNVNPSVAEVPGNGIDDNCNGETDEFAIPSLSIVGLLVLAVVLSLLGSAIILVKMSRTGHVRAP